ncbi:hypothetical protein KEJ33_04215 [Candidatus Bathyarchaeota archaeon]|nr:hypothetical protein [Candidatus Bathyarchaeota archaeon]
MSIFRDLYMFKVKVFLGALRSSKSSLLLIAIYVLGLLPSSVGMSLTVVNLVKGGIDLTTYVDLFSIILNVIFVFLLLFSLRGYVAYEYEQNVIFTSPVDPRTYLLASLLTDITAISIFLFPAYLFLIIIIVSLQLSVLSTAMVVTCLILVSFFIYFIKTSLSILESHLQNIIIRAIIVLVAALLLFPAVEYALQHQIGYSKLPYPSTLVTEIVLRSIQGSPLNPMLIFGVLTYFSLSLILFLHCSKIILFLHCSKIDIYRYAKPIPLVSPFDTSMRTQTIKTGQNIRFFSKVGSYISLNIESKSLQIFLIKKEIVRMTRDGSFFIVLLFYVLLSIISFLSRSSEAAFPMLLFLLSFYAFLVPAMLMSNWRIVEQDLLWIPITAGLDFVFITKAIMYTFVITGFTVPAILILILSVVNNFEPITSLVLVASSSIIGSSINLYTAMEFLSKKRRATPSIMISYVAMFLSGLLISPVYIYALANIFLGFDILIRIVFAVPTLVYSVAIYRVFSKKIERKALNIELS